MKTIKMESEDGIPVNPGGRVIVGDTAFTVTDMKWENFGGERRLLTKATIAELGSYVANHMLFTEDGLTLTGAVHKYMNEMLPGCQACSQAHAERVAGRLSARLQAHIDCAHSENRRLSERLKGALALAEEKEHCIESLRAEAKQYEVKILEKNKRIGALNAELCDAVQNCSTEGLVHELRRRGQEGYVLIRQEQTENVNAALTREIKENQAEIQRLRSMAIPDGMSFAATCLANAKAEAAQKEIARLNERHTVDKNTMAMLQTEITRLREQLLTSSAYGFDQGMAHRLTESSKRTAELEKEIEHLRAAVGKKRGKSDRLGKKIAAQNEEIHRLNELLRRIRRRYTGGDVISFERMADGLSNPTSPNPCADLPLHVNCRCHVEGPIESAIKSISEEMERRAKGITAGWIFPGHVEITGTISDPDGALFRAMQEAIRPTRYAVVDEHGIRPEFEDYATMCPDCGHISGEGGCRECEANREAAKQDEANRREDQR